MPTPDSWEPMESVGQDIPKSEMMRVLFTRSSAPGDSTKGSRIRTAGIIKAMKNTFVGTGEMFIHCRKEPFAPPFFVGE